MQLEPLKCLHNHSNQTIVRALVSDISGGVVQLVNVVV